MAFTLRAFTLRDGAKHASNVQLLDFSKISLKGQEVTPPESADLITSCRETKTSQDMLRPERLYHYVEKIADFMSGLGQHMAATGKPEGSGRFSAVLLNGTVVAVVAQLWLVAVTAPSTLSQR